MISILEVSHTIDLLCGKRPLHPVDNQSTSPTQDSLLRGKSSELTSQISSAQSTEQGRRESNPQPPDLESGALPIKLRPFELPAIDSESRSLAAALRSTPELKPEADRNYFLRDSL